MRKKNSSWKDVARVVLRIVFPLWIVVVPIALCIHFVTFLPYRLYVFLFSSYELHKTEKLGSQITDHAPCSKDVLFFIHGWPDSSRLWSDAVKSLSSEYKCVTVDLPGHKNPAESGITWGYDFFEIRDMIIQRIECENAKVTIVAHDWGCFLSFLIQAERPDLVRRMCLLDVGDGMEWSMAMMIFTCAYQWFNVLAFALGGPAGKFMLRVFLQNGAKYEGRPMEELNSASINYMYYHLWKLLITGSREERRKLRPRSIDLMECPVFFAYGTKKPGMFHGHKWLELIHENKEAGGQSEVHSFRCDHWITVHKSEEWLSLLSTWLEYSSSKKKD